MFKNFKVNTNKLMNELKEDTNNLWRQFQENTIS